MIRNFQGQIVSQKIYYLILIMTFGLLLIGIPVNGKKLEIKQGQYTFNMSVTKDVAHETFVIAESHGITNQHPGSTKLVGEKKISDTCLPVVHFKLGSSDLDTAEGDIILTALKKLGVTSDAPLFITGYACELGPDQYNQTLSRERAETVASFLQAHGFFVENVQGKGSQNPITLNPQEFHWNRRVEIEIAR